MYAPTVVPDVPGRDAVRCSARRGSGAAAGGVRAVLLLLCVLVTAGCGTPTPHVQQTRTVTPAASFVPTAVVGAIRSLHMFDATTGWAATSDRVLRTTDGGLHWQDVTPPVVPAGTIPLSLAMFPRSADEAWVARGLGAGGSGTPQSAISHTTDGGLTWRSITLPVFAVAQITFVDAEHGWMLANLDTADGEQGDDIFRTTDGGQTWTRVASAADRPGALPLAGHKTGLTFRDATTGWATGAGPADLASAVPGDAWLFTTHDGGATWRQEHLALPTSFAQEPWFYIAGVLPAVFFSPEVGVLPVAVGSSSAGGVVLTLVYVTRDGGATWVATTPAETVPDAVSLLDPSHWWLDADSNGDAAPLSTADGGQHWTMLPPTAPFAHLSVLSFVSNTQGWAIDSAGLLRTDDGGRTWTVLAPASAAAS
jgi:photosystem II stability/assembly factor-like uncharacterized protein